MHTEWIHSSFYLYKNMLMFIKLFQLQKNDFINEKCSFGIITKKKYHVAVKTIMGLVPVYLIFY